MRSLRTELQKHFELLFWVAALLLLFFMNMGNENSLCFFRWIGLGWCPGDGIGHSMQSALHFQLGKSFQQHPLGIVGVMIIFNRIKQLSFTSKQFAP